MVFTQRQFRVVEVLFLATLAYELALLANTRVEAALGAAPFFPTTAVASKGRAHLALGNPTLARVFGLTDSSAATDRPSETTSAFGGVPQRSTLHAQLQATTVGDPVDLSWAVIRDLDANHNEVYLLGDSVFDGFLSEVGEGYVLITRPKAVERLDLGALPALVPEHSPEPAAPEAAIADISGNTIRLSEEARQRLVSNPMTFINEIRIKPHLDGGELKGFQVDWMKPGSLLGATGIKGGDVITRINGTELNSAENAMGLLAQVRNAPRVEVEVLRGGQPTTFAIEVHSP